MSISRNSFTEGNIIEYDLQDGTTVLIEGSSNEAMRLSASRSGIAKPDQSFNEALISVFSTMRIFADQLQMSSPNEFEVSFGIRPLPSTGAFVVTQGADGANFNIKLIWKRRDLE